MRFKPTQMAVMLVASMSSAGCYHYHIQPDRVTPSTEYRSETRVAYLWGFIQPNDITPPNCPPQVPLADVIAHTNFGYIVLGTVTLGVVSIQQIEWRCAKDPSVNSNRVQAAGTGKG
ncbi:MAG: hypothetical protein ABW133_25440 [Polyangiaceae bacterium]